MSKAHVRRRKGFCGGRRDEAVRGNAVSADTQVSRASLRLPLLCACPLLPCLITLHVCYYCYCQCHHWWHAWSQVLTQCPGDCTVLFWCAVEGLCTEANELRSGEGSCVPFAIEKLSKRTSGSVCVHSGLCFVSPYTSQQDSAHSCHTKI